jgi:hypothetical protein
MIRTVLENVPVVDVVRYCADNTVDIKIERYVTTRNQDDKINILKGIKNCMALVKGSAHSQASQYYHQDEFIDVFFKNRAWKKHHVFGMAHRPGNEPYDQSRWLEEEGGQQTLRLTLENFPWTAQNQRHKIIAAHDDEEAFEPDDSSSEVSEREAAEYLTQIIELEHDICQFLRDNRWREKKYPNNILMTSQLNRLIELNEDFQLLSKDLPEVLKLYKGIQTHIRTPVTRSICVRQAPSRVTKDRGEIEEKEKAFGAVTFQNMSRHQEQHKFSSPGAGLTKGHQGRSLPSHQKTYSSSTTSTTTYSQYEEKRRRDDLMILHSKLRSAKGNEAEAAKAKQHDLRKQFVNEIVDIKRAIDKHEAATPDWQKLCDEAQKAYMDVMLLQGEEAEALKREKYEL